MTRFRIKLKDAKPQVGIFEVIDDEIGVMSDLIENLPMQNGIVDGGILFHRDLVRKMYATSDAKIYPETREFIKKNYNNPNLHRCFPRGRLCYNKNERCLELYANEETLRNEELINRILAEFDALGYKVKSYVDEQHYNLLPKEELN